MDLWDTFDLKKNRTDSDYVEKIYTVARNCDIGNDHYLIKISAEPGKWNLNGECGGVTYARAKITKNKKVVFDQAFEDCRGEFVIHSVLFTNSSSAPIVTKLSWKKFHGMQ